MALGTPVTATNNSQNSLVVVASAGRLLKLVVVNNNASLARYIQLFDATALPANGATPKLKPLYEQYCLHILPWLGEYVAKDRKAYQYLAESILRFPPQKELAQRMEKAGLSQTRWHNLTGGIAVIHTGWKL